MSARQLVYYGKESRSKHEKMFKRLESGLSVHGVELRWAANPNRMELTEGVFYGMSEENIQSLRSYQGSDYSYYYVDNAYFGRRNFYRITRQRLQHDGMGSSDGKRFRKFEIEIKPWRSTGEVILLALQSELWFQLHDFPIHDFVGHVTSTLGRFTDKEVVVRFKPPPNKIDPVSFLDVLRNVYAVVTWSSNAAVQGVLEGVPAFTWVDCAASTMGTRDLSRINEPPMPDGRLEWASVLADNQWSSSEISRGVWWEKLSGES